MKKITTVLVGVKQFLLLFFLQDCCYLSALQCFRSNLHVHFNVDKKQRKLHRSLVSHLTVSKLLAALSSDIIRTVFLDVRFAVRF